MAHFATHGATQNAPRSGLSEFDGEDFMPDMKPILRAGTFHLRRRVPKRFRKIEDRGEVWISLHTDSASIARDKAPIVWAEHLEAWEAKLRGETDVASERFEAARELAARRGFRFLPARDVARLPLPELVERVDRVFIRGRPDMREADALLGGARAPKVRVSDLPEVYFDLARDMIRGKSAGQVRVWRNPRLKAVENFQKATGRNPALDEITRDDMLDFRAWWEDRLDSDELTANSANKDFTHLAGMIRLVNKRRRLGLDIAPIFSDLAIKEGVKRTRLPFSPAWIREKLLAPGALDGLNLEARCILLGMVNTGYRPSEGANMTGDRIRLDAAIPHISIEPEGRTVKSANAIRAIPLAGVSLEAFRLCPRGFPRYQDKAGLSATLNKFLRENGLMETPAHVVYGLRHSFEDRMLTAGIDDRLRRDLMGHRLDRERYGGGGGLELRLRAIEAIAL